MTIPPTPLNRAHAHRDAEAAASRALARARDAGRPLAVLLVAADDVRRLDRTHGHADGARAIDELEARVRRAAPADAVVVRLGRERIVVCVQVDDRAEAFELARALASATDAPLALRVSAVRVDTAVGVAVALDGDASAADLLRDADGAAQRAQATDGPRWRGADAGEREREVRQLMLEHELRAALARGELALYVQPIVSPRRGVLLGVEALVRWRHPARGLLGPAQFLPAAERSGLIVDVGDWMLAAVVAELERWDESAGRPALPVSLNVSARELRDEGFLERFTTATEVAGVSPERLAVEISEPGALHERDAAETLSALRTLGVRVVLDRFGGDGAALTHVARLPFDGLKLDRSLLGPVAADGETPVVAAVVELAHALGLAVTVPGIETEQQLALVRSLHVDAAQGHLIARPAPAGTIADPAELGREVAAATRASAAAAGTAAEADDEWLSPSAVGAALGVSLSTVRRLADQGVLPGRRTEGGHRRFRRADVQRLARQRRREPSLRTWEPPATPLPATAALLEHDGRALVERSVRALYEPRRPGWFAAPQGTTRSRAWLEALVAALAAGALRDAIAATAAYGDAAALGGASAAEVVRFLGQFGAVTTHELLRARAATEEARTVQRLMTAGAEVFLVRRG